MYDGTWSAAIKIIDCYSGLEHYISAEMGTRDSNCMFSSASSLRGKDSGQDVLPMLAMGWFIVERKQLFFEKQANKCVCFSAVSTDCDRYRPSPTPTIRNTEDDYLRKLQSPAGYTRCFTWVGGHTFYSKMNHKVALL